MENDLLNESLLSFAEAAKTPPLNQHVATVHRWRKPGISGIELEAIRIGGRWCTSTEAISRFCKAITAVANGTPIASDTTEASSSENETDAELDSLGL